MDKMGLEGRGFGIGEDRKRVVVVVFVVGKGEYWVNQEKGGVE